MKTFRDAKAGDKVWHWKFGWVTITSIEVGECPIRIDGLGAYTLEGKYEESDLTSALFWNELDIKLITPSKPLPDLKVDTKVLVWDHYGDIKVKAYFSHFTSEGRVAVFAFGATSWSDYEDSKHIYLKWELAG